MQKIKMFILFVIIAFFASHNVAIFSQQKMQNLQKNIEKKTEKIIGQTVITNAPPAGGNNNAAGKSWSDTIINILIKTTIAALVAIIINPDTVKFIISKISSKYSYELKIQQLTIINSNLKIQLDQLRLNCSDTRIIRAMEATYLKSCTQLMELQKKYLERYAN